MNDATKDAPAFDFYPERWTHGTRMLTKVERCDYIDLLCSQWTDDGLPADLDILARIIGYRKGSQIPALVLEKFPIAVDGKRRNARLESERVKQRERIAKRHYLRVERDDYARIRRRANEHLKKRPVRRRILARDGGCCQQCRSTDDLCLDHVVALARGGDSDDANLQILCRSCNSRKGCR